MNYNEYMKILLKCCVGIFNAFILFFCGTLISVADTASKIQKDYAVKNNNFFLCGGRVESDVWGLWENYGRDNLENNLIKKRLLKNHDVYALYDMQAEYQNLITMASYCQREDKLIQIANSVYSVFDAVKIIKTIKGDYVTEIWACGEFSACNKRGKSANKEIMLTSVQGLGFLSTLANYLAHSKNDKARGHPLIKKTVEVSVAHLMRWGDIKQRKEWSRLVGAHFTDVKNDKSTLFFTDKYLWQIAIYANLAGISSVMQDDSLFVSVNDGSKNELSESAAVLLALFKARLTLNSIPSKKYGKVDGAVLDVGFGSLYKDNWYAGYQGKEAPVKCVNGKAKFIFSRNEAPIVNSLGWDFSHSRRLVPVLTALRENYNDMASFYDLPEDLLSPVQLENAFAAQLVFEVWNGDVDFPLFTNYWDGTNGWYRVGYDDGEKHCRVGYAPYKLSFAFTNGGYPFWGKYYKEIDDIARYLYYKAYVAEKYNSVDYESFYGSIFSSHNDEKKQKASLMFLPSLVR